MKDHSPKPLVETHYHIQSLIDAQQKRVDDRQYFKDKAKLEAERNDLIKDAQVFVVTDFYCYKCKEDFKSMSIKEIEIDWSCPIQNIAFYRTKCSKGHWNVRYITDKLKDSFWMNSKQVARDRGKHFAEILQPFESGYNLLYNKN